MFSLLSFVKALLEIKELHHEQNCWALLFLSLSLSDYPIRIIQNWELFLRITLFCICFQLTWHLYSERKSTSTPKTVSICVKSCLFLSNLKTRKEKLLDKLVRQVISCEKKTSYFGYRTTMSSSHIQNSSHKYDTRTWKKFSEMTRLIRHAFSKRSIEK